MRNKVLFFSIVIAIGVLTFYWVKSSEDAPKQTMGKDTNIDHLKGLEQKVTAFNIDGRTSKGVKQWHLEGNTAEMIDGKIYFNDLAAIAYGEEATVNLVSDKGIYDKENGEVTLIGNVKVTSDDGSVLTTEKATWSQKTKYISSDVLVRIERDNMVATGKGGMASSSDKMAMLKENVEVKIEPDTKVNSDGPLVVKHDENIAVFSDNVKVEDKDGKLFADKLTVHLSPETQKIAKVVAEGNVKVRRGRSYTISEKAIYTESTKSAKLLGNPQVIIDPGELQQLEGIGRK
ncbi:MAG: LPS export ABC transporter periplasmic protein LptC [Candidatus Omnitrophota bacterium]